MSTCLKIRWLLKCLEACFFKTNVWKNAKYIIRFNYHVIKNGKDTRKRCNFGKRLIKAFWTYFYLAKRKWGNWRICVKSVRLWNISLYSVRMRENTDQKKLHIWTLFTLCCLSQLIWSVYICGTILNLYITLSICTRSILPLRSNLLFRLFFKISHGNTKTLLLSNLKTRTALNAKISVLLFVLKPIVYLLIYSLHDCTFNVKFI